MYHIVFGELTSPIMQHFSSDRRLALTFCTLLLPPEGILLSVVFVGWFVCSLICLFVSSHPVNSCNGRCAAGGSAAGERPALCTPGGCGAPYERFYYSFYCSLRNVLLVLVSSPQMWVLPRMLMVRGQIQGAERCNHWSKCWVLYRNSGVQLDFAIPSCTSNVARTAR